MNRQRAYTTLMILATLFLIWAQPLLAQTLTRGELVSNHSFAETVKRLETAIKKRGMMVVAVLDHQNMLRMVGASIRGSKTLEFGKPDMMKTVIPQHPEAGLEMPIKLYIYERADGKAVVSYYKPSGGFGSYGKESLTKVGQMMDAMLGEIVAEATK